MVVRVVVRADKHRERQVFEGRVRANICYNGSVLCYVIKITFTGFRW